MKKHTFFLIFCLCYSVSFYAQGTGLDVIYNVKELNKLAKTNKLQTEEIKKLDSIRVEALKNTENPPIDVNNTYYNSVLNVLTDEQEHSLFKSLINKELKVDEESLHIYPKEYRRDLIEQLKNYNTLIEIANIRYPFNENDKYAALDSLRNKQNNLLINSRGKLKKAKKSLVRYTKKCAMPQKTYQDIIDYNFYVILNNDTYTKAIEDRKKQIKAHDIITKVANCKMESITTNSRNFQVVDSILQKEIVKKYQTKIIEKAQNNISNTARLKFYNPVEDFRAELESRGYDKKSVRKKSLDKERSKKEENEKKAFFESVTEAGISNEKAEQVFQLIEDRNKKIKALKEEAKSASEFDINSNKREKRKDINAIKKDFSKKITTILPLEEYSAIMGKNFTEKALSVTEEEYNPIVENNKLTEKQSQELFKLIYKYHYNNALQSAYYQYDKHLSRQKEASLRYHFEKEYKKMCDDYKIDKGGDKKITNKNFQWK